jgi:hypothetical protein
MRGGGTGGKSASSGNADERRMPSEWAPLLVATEWEELYRFVQLRCSCAPGSAAHS